MGTHFSRFKHWIGGLLMGALCFAGAPRTELLPGAYAFQVHGGERNAASPEINALACDHDNRIWVGTAQGLYRLEGEYLHRVDRPGDLPDPTVMELVALRDGGLWVRTIGGLVFWDGLHFQAPTARGLPELEPQALAGFQVFPLPGQGVLCVRGDEVRLAAARGPLRRLGGLPAVRWLACAGGRDQILLLSPRELVRWQPGGVDRRSLAPLQRYGLPTRVFQARDGGIWLRTPRFLVRLEGIQGPAQAFDLGSSATLHNLFPEVEEGPDGAVWTLGAEVAYRVKEGRIQTIGALQGLPEFGSMARLAFDQEGVLWLASGQLFRQVGGFKVQNYSRRHGLPVNLTWASQRLGDGRLLACTQGGIALGGPEGWRPVNGIPPGASMAASQTADGTVWALLQKGGANEPGLVVFPAGGGKPELFPLRASGEQPFVSALSMETKDQGWLLAWREGLIRLQRKGMRWHLEPERVDCWPSAETANVLLLLKQERMLLGAAAGLALREGGRWRALDGPLGLPGKQVIAAAEAPDGDIWVAYMADNLLVRLTRSTGDWRVVERFLPPHPLVQDRIYDLLCEPDGTLDLGTARGVKRWKAGALQHLGRSAGLASEDCSQRGLRFEAPNVLWVATSGGLSRVELDGPPHPEPLPEVALLSVMDGRGRPFDPAKPIEVAPAFATLCFGFMAQSPDRGRESQVQVRMLGLESEWRALTEARAVYPSMPKGDYVIEARLWHWDGRTGPVTRVAFRVLPRWYQSWWAQVLGLMGLAAVAKFFHNTRVRALRLQNEELDRVVTARTQQVAEQAEALAWTNNELQDANQALGKALREVKTLRGLIPICASCKKIREDEGSWSQLEHYITEHSEAVFSHGLCPECADQMRREWLKDSKE